jgi:ABC transporter
VNSAALPCLHCVLLRVLSGHPRVHIQVTIDWIRAQRAVLLPDRLVSRMRVLLSVRAPIQHELLPCSFLECSRKRPCSCPVLLLLCKQAAAATQRSQMQVRLASMAENAFNAVERVDEFCHIPPEGKGEYGPALEGGADTPGSTGGRTPFRRSSTGVTDSSSWALVDVPSGFPPYGRIQFEHACMRYRDTLPLVLKNLSVTIDAGCKVRSPPGPWHTQIIPSRDRPIKQGAHADGRTVACAHSHASVPSYLQLAGRGRVSRWVLCWDCPAGCCAGWCTRSVPVPKAAGGAGTRGETLCQMRCQHGPHAAESVLRSSARAVLQVGVVGRTGAGKSSIINALFRLTELSSGAITLDGVNIGNMRLSDLRQCMALIPQHPIIFTGTLRSNLVPEGSGSFSDDDLWHALRCAHLTGAVPPHMHACCRCMCCAHLTRAWAHMP